VRGSKAAVTMAISTSFSRLIAYCKRHGLRATFRRTVLALRRVAFSNRMALFYCELGRQTSGRADLSDSLKVERKRIDAELSPPDLQDIINAWNPRQSYRNIQERFNQGASLWLIRSEDRLAGYGWTLQGSTIKPHYFPLGPDDVHLFDFYIFPPHRGRGLNPFLTTYILRNLANDCGGRAYIEVAQWNQAQLSSLAKTSFLHLGWARRFTIHCHTIVCWTEDKTRQGRTRERWFSTAAHRGNR
jgi:hypothetical protein